MLKVNIDGLFSERNMNGGWGFVVRDETGNIQVAEAGRIEQTRNALQSELRSVNSKSRNERLYVKH
uniref:Uncharacterized protein n=1 Tax=Arundo donax TaxID=35708 RepID=A0A0A9BX84_ARUDO